jgi:hypothetical protein
VVKSLASETYEMIRSNYDQAVAVDMESSGFLFAASLWPGVESAVVRGVSDLLSDKNLERDAERQPEAARRASAFTFELLATMPRDVQFRPVTVRWQSPDGLSRDNPVRHLARTFVTPRGEPDVRKERLVGAPEDGAVGEVLNADGSIILEQLRDSDLAPFATEARQILEKLEH